ncbi:MAG: ABC transporter substrate-binding protein [Dehalococcoidales bacterium]|nr:ABC transporter substrate-binding protein [Dehalococcoidales bacterium]
MGNKKIILTIISCLLVISLTLGFAVSCSPTTTTVTKTVTTTITGGTTSTTPTAPPVVVDEWYLPQLVPITGAMAAPGLWGQWTAHYAAEVINDAGGVRGVPINVVTYDAPGDPAKAVTAMSEIIGKKPLFMLGPMDQITMGAVLGLIVDEQLPLNGFFSTKEQLAEVAPLGTHMMPDDVKGAKNAAKVWIGMHPDIKSVALFYYPGLSEESARGAEAGLIESGVTVNWIDINIGQDIDMGPIVTRAMALDVDGYYGMVYGMDFVGILKALSDRGMNEGWRVMSGGQAMGPEILTAGANYNEGVYFWEFFDLVNPGSTEFQDYVAAYGADHDGAFPYTWANWGFYLGVKAFATAIEQLNITGDPAKLTEERKAIEDFFWTYKDFEAFGGTFNYGDGGRVVKPLYVYQVINNQFTVAQEVE